MILWKCPPQQSKYITWCDLMWYSECQGQRRANRMSLTVSTAVQWPHRWVMRCRRRCLSLTTSERKSTALFLHGERRHFSRLQSNSVDETGDFTKGVLSSLNKINETWKWASSCSHWAGGRDGEERQELVLPLPLIIQGITPGEGFIIQIFKSASIKTRTFLSEH